METFFKLIGATVCVIGLIALISTLGAYPTKWLVNYLFAPAALVAVFGVGQFGFWKALTLNLFCGLVLNRASGLSSKKD